MKAVEQMEENGLDLTRCPFSSPFLCTQQLRLPLPQHCQSLTVTLFHFAVWLSCLSSSCSDKWNRTGLAGGSWHDERAFRGEKCRSDPAAFSKGYSGLKNISAKRRMSFSITGTFCLCAKAKVMLHFRCPGTWRRL